LLLELPDDCDLASHPDERVFRRQVAIGRGKNAGRWICGL
jgi:hypothetical protein